MRYSGLDDLELFPALSSDNVDKIFEVTGTPFRDVTHLAIRVEPTAMKKLMENMERSVLNLQYLELRFEETAMSDLPYVSLLSNPPNSHPCNRYANNYQVQRLYY